MSDAVPTGPDTSALRRTLRSLETIARNLGVPIRYDAIVLPGRDASDGSARVGSSSIGRGGLVRVGGGPLILCDSGLPLIDKVAVLAEALASFEVHAIHLPPVMRARLRSRRAASK
jgi:hypothetical protein